MENSNKYQDIIHLSRPTSAKRAKMSMVDRGAQFSPFAALVGYEDAIRETARLTNRKVELTEGEMMALNEKIRDLLEHPGAQAGITHFVQDLRKEGGAYVTENCCIRKVDPYGRGLILADGRMILFENIFDVQEM